MRPNLSILQLTFADRVKELLAAQSVQKGPQKRVRRPPSLLELSKASRHGYSFCVISLTPYSIKKPKTHRYPSLKGTDPKFRRNHRHALHGTMKALKEVKEGVSPPCPRIDQPGTLSLTIRL